MLPIHEQPMRVWSLAAAATLLLCTSPANANESGGSTVYPSLCVSVESGCHVPGGRVRATVVLGSSDVEVVGAQFSLEYDPTALDLLGISPGITCDPSAPFEFETASIVDEEGGKIFYAVGIDPFGGGPGTMGPATVACLEFAVLDSSPGAVCLFNDANPFLTTLVDMNGHAVQVDNTQDCPATEPLPILACRPVEVADACDCGDGPTDCSLLTDDCNIGVCDEDTAQCVAQVTNEGNPCDDHDECTTNETCRSGLCFGTDCQNPSLCVVADDICPEDNSARRRLTVQLGESDREVVGAQFSIQYDPSALELIGISPGNTCDGESPFSIEISETVDNVAGNIFYAVLVDPFDVGSGLGTRGPATLACLEFWLVGMNGDTNVCLFADENPFMTLLAGLGNAVPIYNAEDCPTGAPSPALSCAQVCVPVPTTSEWGLVIMAILLLIAEKLYFSPSNKRVVSMCTPT